MDSTAAFFKLYAVYFANYPNAVLKVRELMATNESFVYFASVFSQYSLQSMESLLTLPLERLPQYLSWVHLIYRKVPSEEKASMSKETIEAALFSLTEAVLKMISNFHDFNAKENVMLVQKLFPGTKFVTPTRYVIKYGEIGFMDPSYPGRIKRRIFILFNDLLVIGTKKKRLKPSRIVIESSLLEVSARSILENTIDGVAHAFRLVHSKLGSYICVVPSQKHSLEWVEALTSSAESARLSNRTEAETPEEIAATETGQTFRLRVQEELKRTGKIASVDDAVSFTLLRYKHFVDVHLKTSLQIKETEESRVQ